MNLRRYFEHLVQRRDTPYHVAVSILRKNIDRRMVTLVDVGSHNGSFVRELSKFFSLTKCVMVEPLPENFRQLRANFVGQEYQIFNAALTNLNGPVTFHENRFSETSSLFAFKSGLPELAGLDINSLNKLSVDGITLDTLYHRASLSEVDILKVDVQGAEHLVFESGSEALSRTKWIWTEVSFKKLYDGSSDFTQIHAQLIEKNFAMMEIVPGYRSPTSNEILQADILFMNTRL